MSHDPKAATNRRHEHVVNEGAFKTLVRDCDNPSKNFEKILNPQLWAAHDQKRAQELDLKQKR